jgi:hypothetical protein
MWLGIIPSAVSAENLRVRRQIVAPDGKNLVDVPERTRRYSLSGLKVEYEQPSESVAADEWEATK